MKGIEKSSSLFFRNEKEKGKNSLPQPVKDIIASKEAIFEIVFKLTHSKSNEKQSDKNIETEIATHAAKIEKMLKKTDKVLIILFSSYKFLRIFLSSYVIKF